MIIKDLDLIVASFKEEVSKKINHRYTSFDYCYNYFHPTNNQKNKDIEKSCLVLGFYLASWGMLRGSSFLLQHNIKHFKTTIEYINDQDNSLWYIDVDNYNEENIKTIIKTYDDIKKLLILEGNSDLTLVTKVLLGVFGFIPAFDRYFCESFRRYSNNRCGFRSVNKTSLSLINEFYISNQTLIDEIAHQTFTIDFSIGKETEINYTKAKIIDMIGFTEGLIYPNKETK